MPTAPAFEPPKGDFSHLYVDLAPGLAAGPQTLMSRWTTPDLSVDVQGLQRPANPAWEAASPALAKDHRANTRELPRTW